MCEISRVGRFSGISADPFREIAICSESRKEGASPPNVGTYEIGVAGSIESAKPAASPHAPFVVGGKKAWNR